MPNVTTEKAVQNQVASAKMEGICFNSETLNLIRKYAELLSKHNTSENTSSSLRFDTVRQLSA